MSAGEAVGDAVFAWCRDALGVVVNEMFGQTEINYIVGNCGRFVDAKGRVRVSAGAQGDARDSLQTLVAGRRRIDVKVDNDLCGDPAPNQANKQMTVTYSCGNGSERRVSGAEGSILAIGCR